MIAGRGPFGALMFRFTQPQGPTGILHIYKGDITEFQGCAIVNAANNRMLGGGGVDGAIHRAAGGQLKLACARYPAWDGDRLLTGECKVTKGFNLPAKWIIHAVGPIYDQRDAKHSEKLLRFTYLNCLALANNLECKKVAFPAISCGVYGYPMAEGARVAIKACSKGMGDLEEVHLLLFSDSELDIYKEAVKSFVEEGLMAAVEEPQGVGLKCETEAGLAPAAPAVAAAAEADDMEAVPVSRAAETEGAEMETDMEAGHEPRAAEAEVSEMEALKTNEMEKNREEPERVDQA